MTKHSAARRFLTLLFTAVCLLAGSGGVYAANICAMPDSGIGGTGRSVDGGIGGTGAPSGGLGGTGRSGMGGTSARPDVGIGGTGRSSDAGIGGTGYSADAGIGGTGAPAEGGIGGTGRGANSGIGGTGRAPGSGIGGTGRESGIGGTGQIAKTGIGGTGIIGVVTGFGSICVNGIEVHYGAATPVSNNGQPASPRDLRIGHVVEVTADGRGEEVRARHVAIRQAASGPVTFAGASGTQFDLMHQPVGVNRHTVVDLPRPTPGANRFAVGEGLSVSGFHRRDGTLVATRIERASTPSAAAAGRVAEVGRNSFTLTTGLRVDGSTAGVRPGREVRVSGEWSGDRLRASRVELQASTPFRGQPDRVVIQGYADASAGAGRVRINGLNVEVGSRSRVLGGSADSVTDKLIQVSGSLDRSGRVRADEIRIEDAVPRPPSSGDDRSGRGGSGGSSGSGSSGHSGGGDSSGSSGRHGGGDSRGGSSGSGHGSGDGSSHGGSGRDSSGSGRDSGGSGRGSGGSDRPSGSGSSDRIDRSGSGSGSGSGDRAPQVERVQRVDTSGSGRSGGSDTRVDPVQQSRPDTSGSGHGGGSGHD